MPSQPLVEVDLLDTSTIVADVEEIQRYNMQRGTFSMLDGITHADDEKVVGFKDIRAEQWWAKDHIPGRPLFPGALMIEAAAQLSSYHFLKHRNIVPEGSFVGFGGLDSVRFRGTVEPGVRFVLAAEVERTRPTMFRYKTQGFVDGQLIFEATVIGVVV